MRATLLPLLLVLLCAPFQARAQENWYRLANVRPHDVDTVKADVILPWGVTLRDQAIRASGFDGWEITKQRQTVTVTESEIAKGRVALAALNKLLTVGRLEVQPLTYEGTDSVYGRIEARWRIVNQDGTVIDVAKWAVENRHTRQ